MSDISSFITSILNAGETGRFSAFMKRSLYIFIAVIFIDIGIKGLMGTSLEFLSIKTKLLLLILSFSVPIIVNLIIFLVFKYPIYGIRFSKKTNLIFAFNLEAVNSPDFVDKYKMLIAEVKNEIIQKDLGDVINVVVAPTNIRLKGKTVAEAKVLLGLSGATLLIWGHIVRVKRKEKFVANFTYEFGRSINQNEKDAKDEVQKYIADRMSRGLVSNLKMDVEHFTEQMMPAIFFILGLSTFTLNLQEKSLNFFSVFEEYYRQSDPSRKKDLSDALSKCHEMQLAIYRAQIPYISSESSNEECNKAKDLAGKIIAILPADYAANLNLAYISDLNNDSISSENYTNIAERNAPSGQYAHAFNKAYFALRRGDYVTAIDTYRKIPDSAAVYAPDISNYLNKRYTDSKNAAFLFADGYVSLKWGDEGLAWVTLEKFLATANQTSHSILIETVRMLKSLKSF